MMVFFMCYVHSLLIVVSITILVHIVFCVVPSWPRLIVYVGYMAIDEHA